MTCLSPFPSIVDPRKAAAPSAVEDIAAALAVAASLPRRRTQTPACRDREDSLLARQRHGDASCARTSPVACLTRDSDRFPPREVLLCWLVDVASPLGASRCARWSPASSRRPPSVTRCLSRCCCCSVAASLCFSLRRTHTDRRHCGLTR